MENPYVVKMIARYHMTKQNTENVFAEMAEKFDGVIDAHNELSNKNAALQKANIAAEQQVKHLLHQLEIRKAEIDNIKSQLEKPQKKRNKK